MTIWSVYVVGRHTVGVEMPSNTHVALVAGAQSLRSNHQEIGL